MKCRKRPCYCLHSYTENQTIVGLIDEKKSFLTPVPLKYENKAIYYFIIIKNK